jgi:hypothetical protein
MITGKPWSDADDATLRAFAPSNPWQVLAAMLGRSKMAVFHRCRHLGIHKMARWTPADDMWLRASWDRPLSKLSAKVGRTEQAVAQRAQQLGLGLGCPPGFEYLTVAARRTGFDRSSLRMILRWGKVKIHESITANRRPRGRWIVDPEKVDRAVEDWLKTETIEAASRRTGYTAEALTRRLEMCGLPLPGRPTGKRHWRIPSDLIDEAIAIVQKRGRRLVARTPTERHD